MTDVLTVIAIIWLVIGGLILFFPKLLRFIVGIGFVLIGLLTLILPWLFGL